MRWRAPAGILFCSLTLVIVLITILLPGSTMQKTIISNEDGINGVVQLQVPSRGWVGDWGSTSLVVEVDETTSTEANLTLRSRLEMAGVGTRPQGNITKVITPGESAAFNWKFRPIEDGKISGVIWLFARKPGGEEELLFAREFSFQSTNYWFLAPAPARVLAGLSLLIGIVLLFWSKFSHVAPFQKDGGGPHSKEVG